MWVLNIKKLSVSFSAALSVIVAGNQLAEIDAVPRDKDKERIVMESYINIQIQALRALSLKKAVTPDDIRRVMVSNYMPLFLIHSKSGNINKRQAIVIRDSYVELKGKGEVDFFNFDSEESFELLKGNGVLTSFGFTHEHLESFAIFTKHRKSYLKFLNGG